MSGMEELDAEKLKISDKISATINGAGEAAVVDLEKAMDNWEEFSIEDKMAIVDCLIESIHAQPGEMTIKWKV